MGVTREALLARRDLPTEVVTVQGVGEVTVRGLTRAEFAQAQQEKANHLVEARIVCLGLVEPVMSFNDVRAWQDVAPALELEPVAAAIARLSGLTKAAAKEAMLNFRDEPGDGAGVLPGGSAGDDGGGTAPPDE